MLAGCEAVRYANWYDRRRFGLFSCFFVVDVGPTAAAVTRKVAVRLWVLCKVAGALFLCFAAAAAACCVLFVLLYDTRCRASVSVSKFRSSPASCMWKIL